MSHTTESPTGAGEMGRRSTPMPSSRNFTPAGAAPAAASGVLFPEHVQLASMAALPRVVKNQPLHPRALPNDPRLRELHATALTAREIGAELGMTVRAVQERFGRLGLSRRTWIRGNEDATRYLTPAEIARFHELRAQRVKITDISTALSIPATTFREAMRRAGLTAEMPDGTRTTYSPFTPERVAVLTKHWPAGTPRGAILMMLNALPGAEVSGNSLQSAALSRGLVRGKQDRPDRSVRHPPTTWTPARTVILEQGWTAWHDAATICAALNELPGNPVTPGAVRSRVRATKLRRAKRIAQPKPPKVLKQVAPKPPAVITLGRPDGWTRAEPVKPAACVAKPASTAPARSQDQPTGRMGGYRYDKPVAPRAVPFAWPTEPVVLPPPGPDGRVEVPLLPLMAWCRQNDIQGFDGSNVEALCKVLALRKLPAVVVVS